MASAPATAILDLVERCRAATYAPLVAKLNSGWVVMGERQVFTGYCLLLPDPVVSHLNLLPAHARAQFLCDMACIGDSLLAVTSAVRINYAMFGNLAPALHAHIFPRYADEPEGERTAQPWAFDWSAQPEYCDSRHGDLKRRIAAHLARVAC